jgi:hypothetical protein
LIRLMSQATGRMRRLAGLRAFIKAVRVVV